MNRLHDDLTRLVRGRPAAARRTLPRGPTSNRSAVVERVGDGVAIVSGLPDARQDELLRVGRDLYGMAVTLGSGDRSAAFCSSPWETIAAGDRVRGTGEVVRVPVGEALLGRVVDPLGRAARRRRPIRKRRDPIRWRARPPPSSTAISSPAAADRHHGRRCHDPARPRPARTDHRRPQDRQDGDRRRHDHQPAAQRRDLRLRAIGQKSSSVGQVIDAVRHHGALERCVFVVGAADATPGLQWIAPYAACTMAEYFRDRGQDALLVLDDLTKHAAVHRRTLAAASPAAGPRGLSGRHLLHPRPPAGAAAKLSPRARRRLADGACRSPRPRRQPQRLHPDQPDLDHGRPDLSRAEAVLRGAEAGRERGQERLAGRRQDPGAGDQGAGRRACAWNTRSSWSSSCSPASAPWSTTTPARPSSTESASARS